MKNNIVKSSILAFIALLQLSAIGCREVTKSSSMALDNANSVIKSGSENLWNDPQKTEKEKKEKEISADKRY